jgi:hypothetical protein
MARANAVYMRATRKLLITKDVGCNVFTHVDNQQEGITHPLCNSYPIVAYLVD